MTEERPAHQEDELAPDPPAEGGEGEVQDPDPEQQDPESAPAATGGEQ
jgi:hypothetical protein